LETNTKSSFSSKSSDFPNRASNICNISNIDKKNIPKPSISRNNINFYNPKESPMINHSSAVAKKFGINKKNSKNIKLKKNKSMENNNKKKYKSSDKINGRKNSKKQILTKKNAKIEKNEKNINPKTSINSLNISKDSFDFLLESITKSKKNENIQNLINDIKINNFNIKKPREENMKFTLLKSKNEENEDGTSEINKSKIIIGNIEGYKDIIESDKINNNLNNETTLKMYDHYTVDNNLNKESKKKNKKILLNSKNKDLLDKKENNNTKEGLGMCNLNPINKYSFTNDSSIKYFLKCMDDENENISTTILKKNIIQKNKCRNLLPYHVNKISFVKKYDGKKKKFLINENISSENILLVDDVNNKTKKNFIKNNNIYGSQKNKETIDINEEYFREKDILRKNSRFLRKNSFNYLCEENMNYINEIQNCHNFCIEGNDKRCVVF
jgi:hypothetical protein